MRLSYHVTLSAVVSAIFFACTRSMFGSMSCFLSGIFIDLDHILDYSLYRKKICLSYKEMWHHCQTEVDGFIIIALHSYELMLILWVAAFVKNADIFVWGILIGFTTHILSDRFFNSLRPGAYFFIYRLLRRFDRSKILKEGYPRI